MDSLDPLPDVPTMLDELERAYRTLVEREQPPNDERARLATIPSDLRWYAERRGSARWRTPPRPGRWSFAENLWHIVGQAVEAASEPHPRPVRYFIDHGKEHVGQAAEMYALFEY
jgi:hypothetical protein